MSLSHSPSIVTDNLLLNIDFKNPKTFSNTIGSNNLVQNYYYNPSTWSNIFPANASLTPGIDAPDGSKNAVRISCKTSGNSLLRVYVNSFTPNGTSTYVISFWVRLISGTTSTSDQLWSDLYDLTPSINYKPLLVQNTWVRVVASSVPSAAAKTFIDLLSDTTCDYVLDFWGLKIENQDTNDSLPMQDLVARNYSHFGLYHPTYYNFTNNGIQFTRTASAPKWGGLGVVYGASGNLTAANFLYNDHTWEVWFKIDDVNFGGYDATEGNSILSCYRGYHAGYLYTASTMYYYIWSGASLMPVCAGWTLGTSGTNIIQGTWCQIVCVKNGSTFIPYINGVRTGNGYSPTLSSSGIGTSNDIHIGAAQNISSGTGSFAYYSKNTISNMKMYNRALSDWEVLKNFNALRGRFGL